MYEKIGEFLPKLSQKKCESILVRNGFALSLGFGNVQSTDCESKNREWRLGSYSRNWRIRKNEKVILGALEPADTLEEMQTELSKIYLSSISDIIQNESGDISISFDNGYVIDFLCMSIDDDGIFHMFCPDNVYIEYNPVSGWNHGVSNAPWN
jgi:hypothetical protein